MKVAFVGAGKMAEAIIRALLDRGAAEAHEIFASDIAEDRRTEMKRRYGINVYTRNAVAVASAPLAILAVKPQQLDTVLEELAGVVEDKHLVISLAAGRRLASLEARLPEARIVRVMPNFPVVVAEGMSVFCSGNRVTATDRETVTALFGCVGRVLELPEEYFDAVTALSGSGPAFLARLLDHLIQAGVALGLDGSAARLLAIQTMLGTARLLRDQDMDPAELVRRVASPQGTTVAGLAILDASPIAEILRETLAAAARRSRELGR